MTDKNKPVHPDIPVDRAWQTGRRLYVRCGYTSRLNTDLLGIGANWDKEVKARWVGSTKRQQLVEVLLAWKARIDEIEAIKRKGLWVEIPQEALTIRGRIRKLGGVYEGEPRYQWALPTEEAYTEAKRLVDQWRAERAAEEKAAAERAAVRRAKEAAERAEAAAAAKAKAEAEQAARHEQMIRESGRTLTGETVFLRQYSTQVMRRAAAVEHAHSLGTVLHLADGRRGIVTEVSVRFVNEEMASSTCYHDGIYDMAHWCYGYELEVVEPTDEERAADAEKAAVTADAEDIHKLMKSAGRLTAARAASWTRIPGEQIAAIITTSQGSGLRFQGGTLTLTTDNRVVWQHPGYYDDYIHTEGISDDPELVARVRAILAAGSRKRTTLDGGQLPTYYEVTTVHYHQADEGDDPVERS